MIKVIVSNEKLYGGLLKIPLLGDFFSFDIERINKVKSEDLFVQIIDRIRMGNGTFKTTKKQRFADIDEALLQMLDKNKKYKIHDVAVSDGITSTELLYRLHKQGFETEFHISDKYSRIFVCERFGVRVYRDIDGEVLFIDFQGILADKNLPRKFFLSQFLGKILKSDTNFSGRKKKILLLNPTTMQLMKANKLHFKNFDIFDTAQAPEQYDIIRCMNILNTGYFSEDQIQIAAKGLITTLKQDGLFIVGRTDIETSKNYAGIYKKSGTGLLPFKEFNGGAEIAHLLPVSGEEVREV